MQSCAGAPRLEDVRQWAGRLDADAWRSSSDEAQVVASYLACHPAVQKVRYPGLKSDPDFARAANTLVGGFGPWVTFWVAGECWMLECAGSDPRQTVIAMEGLLRQ